MKSFDFHDMTWVDLTQRILNKNQSNIEKFSYDCKGFVYMMTYAAMPRYTLRMSLTISVSRTGKRSFQMSQQSVLHARVIKLLHEYEYEYFSGRKNQMGHKRSLSLFYQK